MVFKRALAKLPYAAAQIRARVQAKRAALAAIKVSFENTQIVTGLILISTFRENVLVVLVLLRLGLTLGVLLLVRMVSKTLRKP